MDLSFAALSSTMVSSLSVAATHASTIGSSALAAAHTLPTAATNLTLVEKPIVAAARGTQWSSMSRLAAGVSRVLPWVTIGASAVTGAYVVRGGGYSALVSSKEGRGAVLGALGGALLVAPTPHTQIAASVVLAGIAANEMGALGRFDRSHRA